ncbi:MAG: hypothetical protein ACLULM_02005 [Acutalibacter sp.]
MRVRKPWDIPPGSQGCSGAGRQYARKRPRRGSGAKLLLALVTLCNVGLSLALAVLNRQETIRAVRGQQGDEVRVLLSAKKETKTP